MRDFRNPSIFGIEVTDLSRRSFVTTVAEMTQLGKKGRVYNVNVHALNIAFGCPRFRGYLSKADLVFNDGHGVNLAAHMIGSRLNYRNTVDDWMDEFLAAVNASNKTIFLLGDEEFVVSHSADLMSAKHQGLRIVGVHHGFFHKIGLENDLVVKKINDSAPDILLVGMSMPVQEFWIEENFDRLEAKVFVPVGAAFRWYSGLEKRAPKWVTDHGLEWLARFIRHPKKLFRRYIMGNPLFFVRLLRTHWFNLPLPVQCLRPISAGCIEGCSFKKGQPTA